MLWEMQWVSSRIWTRVAVFISYDDNNYTAGTSNLAILYPSGAKLVGYLTARLGYHVRWPFHCPVVGATFAVQGCHNELPIYCKTVDFHRTILIYIIFDYKLPVFLLANRFYTEYNHMLLNIVMQRQHWIHWEKIFKQVWNSISSLIM